ncbi:hypothetical protein K435DRAFT_877665 [Dendrothele bispora CBS 962.96]|uniref:Uncharacterized protein n=1 Tax=Dendrothele bispora (strain CBS 962.96) TaxID=1314807 RepID=A0A4S8KPS0_DENBC|nr:hypothetical protein K435DRAFT_877665 [Dendrothele bispora CBS 962.96]
MNLAWNDVIYLDPIPTLEVSFHYVQYGHRGETAITSLVFKVTKPEPLGSNPRLPACAVAWNRVIYLDPIPTLDIGFHYVQHGQHGETVITSSVFEVTNQEVLGSNPRLPDKRFIKVSLYLVRHDLLLSDTSEFQDLYIAWITNTITSSNVTSSSGPPTKRRYRLADVVWKSDVSQAYRRIPMDPRCNNFGNRGAGGLWGALMGLVAWIARFIKLLEDIFTYVDDNFGADEEENMLWYEKYEQWMPEKQVRLLQLWDELGIPHEKEKQLFGLILIGIIGFEVDPNAMTITMPLSSKSDLINAMVVFAQYKQRRTLREYQQIGGWCNWALNVYPLLRPGLSQLYHKISGKSEPDAHIWVSRVMCRELLWMVDHMRESEGVRMLESDDWTVDDADITLYCDACLDGLGFWFNWSGNNFGFQHVIDHLTHGIFFYEALSVLSALVFATGSLSPSPRHIVIYTDNMNTVDMFNTLKATPDHNTLLPSIQLVHDLIVERGPDVVGEGTVRLTKNPIGG